LGISFIIIFLTNIIANTKKKMANDNINNNLI
jgi:hypothetical protein